MTYQIPIELYQEINPLLQEPLAYNDIDKLKQQLAAIQAIRYKLSYARCELYKRLLDERERMRVPKDKEYTELDRKTMLQSSTSILEQDYEFMVALELIITDAIGLGQTFLQS